MLSIDTSAHLAASSSGVSGVSTRSSTGLPYFDSPTWKYGVSDVASMKLPAEYTWNRRMPSPWICPPSTSETLKSTPERLSEAPSRSCTWRTAAPSTRAASNMLRAFQMVMGSPSTSSLICVVCRISRTDCEMLRLPADSSTMKRSPAFSYTIILRNELIWSSPALVRESDRNTSPALSLMATQYVMGKCVKEEKP